jgi:hypothetical protein
MLGAAGTPHKIDVGDAAALGPTTPLSSADALTHEVVEATMMQGNGASFNTAHAVARATVAAGSGWTPLDQPSNTFTGAKGGNGRVQGFNFSNGNDTASVVMVQMPKVPRVSVVRPDGGP